MRIFVNEIDRSYCCLSDSLTFSDDVSKRSIGEVTFKKKDSFMPRSGDRIEIFDDDNLKIFGGFIKRPRLKPMGGGFPTITVEIVDNTDIASRRIVAETYIGWQDHDIVKDIHSRYLAQDGIKLGVISSGTGSGGTEEKIETTEADFVSGILTGLSVDEGGTVTLEDISDNPPVSRIVEDFEDEIYNFSFNGDWYRTAADAYEGSYSFRSDSIDDRETSMTTFPVTVREGAIGKLSLFYKTSSEQNEDFFELWANQNVQLMRDSGINGWKYFYTTLPAGTHEITLMYDKDKSGSWGQDRVYVDRIIFEEWEGMTYPTQGERIAPKITSLSDTIKRIKIEYDGDALTGTNIEFYYSLDSQETWELAVDNEIKRSINGPVGVDVKVVLTTTDTTKTPELREIKYILETTTGTAVTKAVFNYVKAGQAFDELCDLSGATWWITPDKVLHYVAREEFDAPFEIDSNKKTYDKRNRQVKVKNLEVETDMEKYRNRQYLRAGRDVTDVQTERMKGDGSKRTFTVGYPIAEEPTILINDTEYTVGIREKDKNRAFYWVNGEKEITQDESQTPLLDTEVLEVQYKGYFPIILVTEDENAISEMAERTGDTGLFEEVEDNQNIDNNELALEFANSKLRKYAKINKIVKFETKNDGLQAGQLIPINIPEYELNDEFLITSVEYIPVGDKIEYKVSCVDGEDVGGWETFFKQLARGQKTYVIRENEVLIRLATQAERIGFAEEMDYEIFACRFPSTDLYPSTDFYPC